MSSQKRRIKEDISKECKRVKRKVESSDSSSDSDDSHDLFIKSLPVRLTKVVAIDCEFVSVGPDGKESMLARVSVVNYSGETLIDYYVKPTQHIMDYRTWVSGILPEHLKSRSAKKFVDARRDVERLIKDRYVVGHSLYFDWKALQLTHPEDLTCDIVWYQPFRDLVNGGNPGLKKLSLMLLNKRIQEGSHDSVVDAKIALKLYKVIKTLEKNKNP